MLTPYWKKPRACHTVCPTGFGFVVAKPACVGNLHFATGEGAAPARALRCFWLHGFDPLTPDPSEAVK